MFRITTLLVVMLLTVSVAGAVPVDCSLGVANVTSLTDGCFLGSLLFDDFVVSSATLTIGINPFPLTSATGGNANLNFEVNPQIGPATAVLIYSVSNFANSLLGADINIGVASGTGVSITEVVCGVAPIGTFCGDVLASFAVDNNPGTGTPAINQAFFTPPVGMYWILKDIQIGSGSSLSDFNNSHHVPEPMTFLLMGTGLLALGLLRRRRQR